LESPAFIKMDAYASGRIKENLKPKRARYELLTNSCLHFMKATVEAGGAALPGILAPNPAGDIVQVQLQQHQLEFDARSGTLTVGEVQLE
jgi:acyl CoA:acetate/3-ketoacid CoA transferase alpha subunit